MKNYFISIALLFGAPLASANEFEDGFFEDSLAEDVLLESDHQPTASEGFGRMFAYHQALVQSLDAMVWFINFGDNLSTTNWKRFGPVCDLDVRSTSSTCRNEPTSDAVIRDALRSDKRRRFHTTITYLDSIKDEAIKNVHNIGLYYLDKSWGSDHRRCNIYNNFGDIKQDWPRFLTAFRDDRRGLPASDKELYGLYFAYAKRTYSHYLEVMNKLAPSLRKACGN